MLRGSLCALVVMGCVATMAAAAGANKGDVRFVEVSPRICDPTVKQYAGYVTIDPEAEVEYFFWFFESRSNPSTDPVALWMTGGPGCSSELAIFKENGPCHVQSDLSTTSNPFSWNEVANMLYIDQPAGTGFSTGEQSGYAHNEKEVAQDMYVFLQGWFKEFSQYQSNEFFITGESYGGHYVPATSYRVQVGNANKEGIHLNLKGVAVGNGLTDPEIQYQFYAELAYNYSIARVGEPRITLSQYEAMKQAEPQCISMIRQCQQDTSACVGAEQFCNNAMMAAYQENGWNPYDIRVKCAVYVSGRPPLCYSFKTVTDYLAQPSVMAALGVTGKSWSVCNFVVNAGFGSDWMKDYQQDIPPQLGNGTRFLIYAGDCGFICNFLGNQAWALQLDWPGKTAFNAAKVTPWMFDGKQAGLSRTAQGFTFLQVHNAGHMVPMDVPGPALAMFKTFITTGTFP